VDSSVAIKLFVVEPDSAQADALFAHLAADPETRFYAPSLLYAECANILWKYVRRLGCPRKNAERSLSMLMDLSIDSIGIAEIILDAHRIAQSWDVSVYDACYAAAAVRMNVPLITADARLAAKLAAMKLPVFVLGRFAVPPVLHGAK
jgi:predicted nucleic acid-binding protein